MGDLTNLALLVWCSKWSLRIKYAKRKKMRDPLLDPLIFISWVAYGSDDESNTGFKSDALTDALRKRLSLKGKGEREKRKQYAGRNMDTCSIWEDFYRGYLEAKEDIERCQFSTEERGQAQMLD